MKRSLVAMLAVLLLASGLTLFIAPEVSAQQVGTNWIGSFWNNTDQSGSPVVTNEPYPNGVYFNWASGPPLKDRSTQPVAGVNADNFSARFISNQVFAQAGTYTFTVYANDGVRVTINGQIVLNQFIPFTGTSPNYATYTFTQTVSAGQSLDFVIDYVDFTGDAILVFQWGVAGGGFTTPIGPTATAVPPALGSVNFVRGLAVRTGPYLGASMVAVARPDNSYPVLEKNFDEGLFPWYKIQVGDRIGWSSGRYLEVTGNLDAVPETQTIFDQIDNPTDLPPRLDVIGYTRSVMNIRRRPSQRTQLLGQVPWGDPVRIIGRTVQGGMNFWLHIQYEGITGWIYAPYVKIVGLIDAVPIR
ncbi:MAG: SH3 domain-containing protein [Chloroflexi bacterium]|nr:MAG: PA14 domain-containing protein [Chloroflexi bacterium OLB13]MBC6955233.1 hypothetical protein [Chloroflexota bacterium]MBV6434941.1 hypothetical protein [Anaerolineae bacterium]MDL1917242.1 hypothetical protein [Anaerolineae bacterium CFX4]OQY82569.1 MAG: hypothetical protein B6D42_09130 [Anaerolineae bacterium UTCFX5]